MHASYGAHQSSKGLVIQLRVACEQAPGGARAEQTLSSYCPALRAECLLSACSSVSNRIRRFSAETSENFPIRVPTMR